jgi:4-amino-4-deoxy-L-arabinose transferase-like glycosyltransferase
MTRRPTSGNLKRVVGPRPALFLLLTLALLIRVGWVSVQRGEPDERLGDQFEYLQVGRNLLKAHELKLHDARFDQDVYAYRMPGYPALIAACGGNVRGIRLAQAILDTGTVLAIYLLARRYLTAWPSLAAAALVAINPFLVYFTALVLSETLFIGMLAWALYLLTDRRLAVRWSGLLLLSLAALVRPSALGLVPLLAIGAAWTGAWRAILRDVVVACVLLTVVLFPWAYRNAHHPQVRSWVWATTNGGITAYDGFHDGATGASDQKAFMEELRPLLSRMDEVERDAYLSQRAHEWMTSHPAQSLYLGLRKIGRTWSPIPLSNEYGGNRLYVAVGLLYTIPFDLLILLGLWKSGIARSAKVFLLLPAIYFTTIHALSVGSLRYRIPVEPPMAVIAGSALIPPIRTRRHPTNGP